MNTTWERPQPHENAFAAWLCYDTTIAALKPRKSTPDATSDMFGTVQAAANSDDVIAAGREDYRMRLPFTDVMLSRRQENGRDVPEFWRARVIEVNVEELEAA